MNHQGTVQSVAREIIKDKAEEKTVASELKRLDNRRANLLREFYYKLADALPQSPIWTSAAKAAH